MPRSVLIVGCGFVGLPLARNFARSGWETHAITASESSALELQSEPFAVYAVNITDQQDLAQFATRSRGFDVVVHCASSGRGGSGAYAAVFFAGTQNLIANLQCQHLIFSSSTSVYAQTDGSAVDETSAAEPTGETGQILRETEELVLASGGTVARLAGLYGPGRCAPLQKLLEGRAIIEGDGERFMNMLHQMDAADALLFLAGTKSSGLFNVVDNCPVAEIDWYQYVCPHLDMPLPSFGPRNLNRKRGWTNKRVVNQKLRALGWHPTYPTFKEGLSTVRTDG